MSNLFIKKSVLSKCIIFTIFFFALFQIYLYRAFQPDDTFIYLVYIKNFIHGNGLTFNGQYVEGFSSIAWVYINALLSWLPFQLLTISKLIGIVSYFLTLALMLHISIKLFKPVTSFQFYLFLLIYVTCPVLLIWSVSGMESMFYALVLLLSVYYYFKLRTLEQSSLKNKQIFSGLLFGFLATIRPEAFALAGIVLLYEIILFIKIKQLDWKFYLNFLYGYICVIAMILIWRYSLYGELFPSTALAKTGDIHRQVAMGKDYVTLFVKDYWFLVFVYLTSIVIGLRNANKNIFMWNILSFIVVSGYTLFIIAAGGDWMISYRFFVPIIPFVLMSIFINLNKKSHILLLILLVLFFAYKDNIYFKITSKRRVPTAPIDIRKYIKNKKLKVDATIAVVDAGAIPFYSGLSTIDMVGLNNKHIAHMPGGFMLKYDNEYVLSKKPYFIQMHTQDIDSNIVPLPDFIGTTALYYMDEFQKKYVVDKLGLGREFFKLRNTPLQHTFLDTFYNYHIKVVDSKSNYIKLKITKLGDGVWLKSPGGFITGYVYIKLTIENRKSKIVYQKLLPITKNMQKGENDNIRFYLPALNNGTYKIKITPILMDINEFESAKNNPFESYLHIDEYMQVNEIIPYKSNKIKLYGFSDKEENFVWSSDYKAAIKFTIKDNKKITGLLKLQIGTLGKQEIKVKLNGHSIGDNIINSNDTTITFNFNKNYLIDNHINTIEFEFPNAHKPNNGDPRVLAMALKSLSIE